MGARGLECRRGGLQRGGGNLGGLSNCSIVLHPDCDSGYMAICVCQNSQSGTLQGWILFYVNYALSQKWNVSDRDFLCNLCFQSPCVTTICFRCSEYKQCRHVWLHACLRRNVGQIIDLNSLNCCLKVEVIKAIWLIAAWKNSSFMLEPYIAEWLDSR